MFFSCVSCCSSPRLFTHTATPLRLRCKHTFIDSCNSESGSEELETRSCPPAFPGLVEQQRVASESETMLVDPPFWTMHVLCRISCQPLRMSHTAMWLQTLRRLRNPDVPVGARVAVMNYKDWLARTERHRRRFPLYSFAELRHFVNIVSVVNGVGAILLSTDRNCSSQLQNNLGSLKRMLAINCYGTQPSRCL